jgi:hypothetical protein
MLFLQNQPINLQDLPKIITAVGGLGTAAFGLLEAIKAVIPWINTIGFPRIKKTVQSLTPGNSKNALSQDKIIATVEANWINGTDLNSQRSIAKSLIKLNLSPDNTDDLARVTGLDSNVLSAIATKIKNADPKNPLVPSESDVYGRFDLIVTALLDETYQHSDNVYRNWTRAWAAFLAVVLAVVGGLTINADIWQCVFVGLLATPLAPIAKDLSTALATAVNTMQVVKKAN